MRALAIVLALAVTGCSFLLTSGPRDEQPRRTYPSCTTSNAWPIVDTVFTVLFLSAMASAIGEDDKSSTSVDDNEASKAEKVTSAALFAALTGVSAYVGFSRVSRCRGAKKEFAAQGGYYQQPYGPPYGQPYGQQPYPQPYYPNQPQPYPGQTQPQPATAPQPTAPQPATAPQPQPSGPQPTAVPAVLGTEGDVCASKDECAPGLACTGNVCKRPPAR